MQDKSLKLWQFLVYAILLIVTQTIGATLWVAGVNSELERVSDNRATISRIQDKQDKQDSDIREMKVNLKQQIEKQGYKWITVE